jgi:hypothetical protein
MGIHIDTGEPMSNFSEQAQKIREQVEQDRLAAEYKRQGQVNQAQHNLSRGSEIDNIQRNDGKTNGPKDLRDKMERS